MLFAIKNSYYYQAFKKEANFKDEEDVKFFVSKNRRYRYGNFQREKVIDSITLPKKTFLGRMISSVGLSLHCGLIMTVTHLAKASFTAFDRAFCRGDRSVKAHVYSALRDLQEAVGHLESIFWQKKGFFRVEEAQFHKQIYCYFNLNMTLSDDSVIYRNFPSALSFRPIQEQLEKDRALFAKYSVKEVNAALQAGVICHTNTIRLLSDEQMKAIPLSELSEERIKRFFPSLDLLSPSKMQLKRDKELFGKCDSTQISLAIKAGLVDQERANRLLLPE